MQIKILLGVFFVFILEDCKINQTNISTSSYFVSDSLMYFVKIDSNNIEHINSHFGSSISAFECNLDKPALQKIENDIQSFLSADAIMKKRWKPEYFYSAKRQYMCISMNTDSCLYVLYTYYPQSNSQLVKYYKMNKQLLERHLGIFYGSPNFFQLEVTYSFLKSNKIRYFDRINWLTSPD